MRGQKKSVTFALPPPTNASTLLPTPVAQPPRPPHRLSVPTPYNPSREYLDAVKEVWALAKAYKTFCGVRYNIFKKSARWGCRKRELAAYLDDPAVKEDLLDIIERVQEENRVQNEELKEDEGEEGQSDDNELEAANAGGVVVEHDEDDTNAAAALLSLHDQGPRIQEKGSKETEGEEEKADEDRAKANAVVTEHNDDDNNAADLLLGFHYQGGTVRVIQAVSSTTEPEPAQGLVETDEKKQREIPKRRAPKAKPMVPQENARPVRRGRSATAKALAEEESAPKSSDEKEETKETETKEPRKPLSQIDNGQVDDEPQAGPSSEKAPATKATAKGRAKRKRGDEEEELLDISKGVAKEKKPARPRKKRTALPMPIHSISLSHPDCKILGLCRPEEVRILEGAGVAE